jgi:serine/threonine protein kinase
MATGSPAFDADNLPAIVHRVLCGRPTPLRRRRPDLPDSFERLVARALDPDPARRPRDAEALRAELREVVEWSGEQSVTDVDLPPFSGLPTDRVVVLAAPPRRRRLRWPLALGLALGFLVAAASGVALAAALTGS